MAWDRIHDLTISKWTPYHCAKCLSSENLCFFLDALENSCLFLKATSPIFWTSCTNEKTEYANVCLLIALVSFYLTRCCTAFTNFSAGFSDFFCFFFIWRVALPNVKLNFQLIKNAMGSALHKKYALMFVEKVLILSKFWNFDHFMIFFLKK